MRIFAIDPGPTSSAWIEYETSKVEPPGRIISCLNEDNKDLEARLYFNAQHARMAGDRVVCEDLGSQGGSVGDDTFATAKQIGRFGLIAQQSGLPFDELQRATVKEFLLGSRTGKDAEIRARLLRMYNLPLDAKASELGPLKAIKTHLWAALAVAVAWDIRELMRQRAAKEKQNG